MFEYYEREQLYIEVWEKPMSEACKKYSISDVALKKICKKLRVATPPRGYWAKKANGQAPAIPKLIPFDNPPKLPIRRTTTEDDIDAEPKLVPEAFEEANKLIQPITEVPIPKDLEDVHPYVRNTRKVLKRLIKKEYRDDYNRISNNGNDGFNLCIGSESIDRASIILQALCSTILENGFEIILNDKNAACFRIMEENIEFEIFEESKKVESSKSDEKPSRYSYRDYDFNPSGVFKFEINTDSFSMSERTSWNDTKTKPIESRLIEITHHIIRAAAWKKEYAAKRIEQKKEWKIEEEKRAAKARLDRIEKNRVELLQTGYKKWIYHRELTQYVEAVKSHYIKNKGKPDGDFAKWIEWAEGYLKQNNPLNGEYPKFEVDEYITPLRNWFDR